MKHPWTDPEKVFFRELKAKRRQKTSALNYIRRVLSGERVSIFMKSWPHMHARAKRLQKEIDEINETLGYKRVPKASGLLCKEWHET